MIAKRIFDLSLSIAALPFVSPVFLLIGTWIKLDSPGPVFFRQVRVGRFGRPFRIYKFRSMCMNAESKGGLITFGDDVRVTRAGQFLRRYKLDEMPQLLNVVLGQMSLVGPRPEVPHYVALYPEDVREKILSVPPGITDYASIEFRDESVLLSLSGDPEATYVNEVMPIKLRYNEKYIRDRSLWVDLKLISATIQAVVFR